MSLPLFLASSSVYRKELLGRLGLPVTSLSPNIDESPLADETPEQLVLRLSQQKARAVANEPGLYIGSDQVAALADRILGKPLTHAVAQQQLRALAGHTVTFYTGLALFNSETERVHSLVHTTQVRFRQLSDPQINYYLETERPYDCAGSFKSEGLGIALFEAILSDDPTGLIGLPLIKLLDLLQLEGVGVLRSVQQQTSPP